LDYFSWNETNDGGLKMDFHAAIKTLQFYLTEQSFLQKLSTFEELENIETPVISLILSPMGHLYYLPDEILFRKGISFLNDDWVDFESMAKEQVRIKKIIKEGNESRSSLDQPTKYHIIKSTEDLLTNLEEGKLIKSGYWSLFTNCPEIKLEDNLLILKKTPETGKFDELLSIKGPMSKKDVTLPDFLGSQGKIIEFTYQTTPYTIPPRKDHLLSYRELRNTNKLTWDMNQIKTYLDSIWNEKSSSTTMSRLNLLFESVVLLTEKKPVFNKFLHIDKVQKTMVGIPSNFIIGVCGGYARGEYFDSSDLDMLLIHEGNDQHFYQVGEALDQVLRHVPNLELCNLENLLNLNFHEDTIPNLLQAFLTGDEYYFKDNQIKELGAMGAMLSSVEELRKTPLSSEERKHAVSKYCWSIYKSLVNMVPIYEKPIGKGQFLQDKITTLTKNALHDIIPILLQITESLKDENNALGENLRICQPFLYNSIFKTYSVITALQDLSTILAVFTGITFTSSTTERFKLAIERNIISEEQGMKLISGYTSFSEIKYKLTSEMPIEVVELINVELKTIIVQTYNQILQNIEPEESGVATTKIAYPLLVFSDLHWGLNNKLAKECLAEIKNACDQHHIRSILIAGDVFNVDRVNELVETDKEGISLLNELSQIQKSLGDQRIHIISGNHDPFDFYDRFRTKLERKLDIYFLGDVYNDENIWIEHGNLDFWKDFTPPLNEYISKFRTKKDLPSQKLIVGHNHRIYEEVDSGFYANGSIGKMFSALVVKDDSLELLRLPIIYSIDFDKISAEYAGITNAEDLIDQFVQDNFKLIESDQYCTNIQFNTTEKETWIITQDGSPSGFIPFNLVEKTSKLQNIQVFEVSFPINYTFKLGQTLKEAWGIFSITGESLLPVMDDENMIIGTLSIFSVPKPEKEHATTKIAEIDEKMESVGNFLTDKLFDKQKNLKD
jgi:predicted nucleotidyltransferase